MRRATSLGIKSIRNVQNSGVVVVHAFANEITLGSFLLGIFSFVGIRVASGSSATAISESHYIREFSSINASGYKW